MENIRTLEEYYIRVAAAQAQMGPAIARRSSIFATVAGALGQYVGNLRRLHAPLPEMLGDPSEIEFDSISDTQRRFGEVAARESQGLEPRHIPEAQIFGELFRLNGTMNASLLRSREGEAFDGMFEYLGGFLDQLLTFFIEEKIDEIRPVIQVHSQNPIIQDVMQDLFAGRGITSKSKLRIIREEDVMLVLDASMPYLRLSLAQARVLREFIARKVGERHSDASSQERISALKGYSERMKELKEVIIEQRPNLSLARIAGMFDAGFGSLRTIGDSKKRILLDFHSIHPGILEDICEFYGGKIKKTRRENVKNVLYSLGREGDSTRFFLQKLLPYLQIRRAEVESLLALG